VNDPEVETLLRRYRPSGPPQELRARVVDIQGPGLREWCAVAASLLLAATFYWLAGIERERVSAMLGPQIETASAFEESLP
jgi:hypothetical protein